MNISSSWVAESTLLLCRPPTKAATMAEIPAAMLLISRKGAQDGAFHGAGDVLDLFDGGLHGVIDLLQTGMGTVTRGVKKVAHALDLFAPGTDDGDGLVRDVRDTGADIPA